MYGFILPFVTYRFWGGVGIGEATGVRKTLQTTVMILVLSTNMPGQPCRYLFVSPAHVILWWRPRLLQVQMEENSNFQSLAQMVSSSPLPSKGFLL